MFRLALIFSIIILSAFISTAQQKIRIELNSLPADHPPAADIFIAGSFNGWNPQNKNYQFQKEGDKYFLVLSLNSGSYEFKLTRGGWDKVECAKDGKEIGNRTLKVDVDEKIELTVEGWKDKFAVQEKKSTATKNVSIIDTAFFIPQLNRYRRVWIYLPAGYETSKKKYPVLYMHDGQNVFEDSSSFSGEWGVDEFLDSTKSGESIVVAIDNGGNKRLNEYCPYDFSLSGIASNYESNKGEGALYVEFLAKTLKPFIDKNYRTLKKRKNTFVAGSSMGGLISLYAILDCPKVFGVAGVFSSSFWVAPDIFDEIKARGKKVKGKIYFYAGKEEGETMVPLTIKAFNEMHRVSKSKMTTVIRTDGKHNEARWRIEFPMFYEWLMK